MYIHIQSKTDRLWCTYIIVYTNKPRPPFPQRITFLRIIIMYHIRFARWDICRRVNVTERYVLAYKHRHCVNKMWRGCCKRSLVVLAQTIGAGDRVVRVFLISVSRNHCRHRLQMQIKHRRRWCSTVFFKKGGRLVFLTTFC